MPNFSTPMIDKFIEKRLEYGAANATVNRDLAALQRMLNMGAKQTPPKVNRVPYIQMLTENNTKKGFFEHGQFLALRNHLPDYLKGFVTFGYKCGWRISEITDLTWKQVDIKQGIVRLETGTTKNTEGRTVYLDDELLEVFKMQWENRKRSKALTPYVFPNTNGSTNIQDFRRVWSTACRDTGIGYGYKLNSRYAEKWESKLPAGPTFHDFRRTAVRNMVRAGIPERVCMMVSGHKTRAVFDRYDIVNDADLRMAAKRQAAYLESQNGYKTVTIADFSTKKGDSRNG